MVEEVRLESVYTPKGYREFESLPLRKKEEKLTVNCQLLFFLLHLVKQLVIPIYHMHAVYNMPLIVNNVKSIHLN